MTSIIKLTLNRNVLLNTLNNIQGVISIKNIIDTLACIRLKTLNDKLQLTGTDMEILVSELIPCDIDLPGEFLVNSKSFFDIVRKSSEEKITINANTETGRVQVKCGKSRFTLPCLSAEDFPNIEGDEDVVNVGITKNDFLNLLNKSKFAASNNETQWNLCGVNLHVDGEDSLLADATNGHKLARIAAKASCSDALPKIIIPSKAVAIIVKILNKEYKKFELLISQNKICITCDNLYIIAKLIDGIFPDIDSLFLDREAESISINRELFLKAIDRVSLASDEKTNAVTLLINQQLLTISAKHENGSIGEEDLDIQSNLQNTKLTFNSIYLIEVLSNIENDDINFLFYDRNLPIHIVNPNNDTERYAIMSMRG